METLQIYDESSKNCHIFLQLAGTAKALAEGGTDEEKTKLVSKQPSTESDVWNEEAPRYPARHRSHFTSA